MLEDKWSAHIGVALAANRVLIGCRFQVVRVECSVGVVAIAALNQALIHLVMEGHAEGGFHVRMALKAESRLRSFQQLLLVFARVNTVAADAANIRLRVR